MHLYQLQPAPKAAVLPLAFRHLLRMVVDYRLSLPFYSIRYIIIILLNRLPGAKVGHLPPGNTSNIWSQTSEGYYVF